MGNRYAGSDNLS